MGLATVCVACRSGSRVPSPSEGYGYIVIGPAAATAYGMSVGDTLGEVEAMNVPQPVVQAARREAIQLMFDPGCTRYFQSGTRYLSLLRAGCAKGVVIDDGQGMALFGSDGTSLGATMPQLIGAYTDIWPAERSAPDVR